MSRGKRKVLQDYTTVMQSYSTEPQISIPTINNPNSTNHKGEILDLRRPNRMIKVTEASSGCSMLDSRNCCTILI